MEGLRVIAILMSLTIEAGKKLALVIGVILYICFAVAQPILALVGVVVFFAAKPHVEKWYHARKEKE